MTLHLVGIYNTLCFEFLRNEAPLWITLYGSPSIPTSVYSIIRYTNLGVLYKLYVLVDSMISISIQGGMPAKGLSRHSSTSSLADLANSPSLHLGKLVALSSN